jgi:hypothetical protein
MIFRHFFQNCEVFYEFSSRLLLDKAAFVLAKEKGTVTPVWAQSCLQMCQTGQCSQGSKAILNRQNSGRDASINVLSVPQERPVVKKTAHQLDTCHLFLRPTL